MINTLYELSKWDSRFLKLACEVKTWSKDPSTQTGAVIVGDRQRVLSLGFNGFPRNISDLEERLNDRETKYLFISHAERNALDNAETSVVGATIYCTFFPCHECAKSIIQRGISRVVALDWRPEDGRWDESFDTSLILFEEAGIQVDLIPAKVWSNYELPQ